MLLISYWTITVIALLLATLLTLFVWECQRFVRIRLGTPLPTRTSYALTYGRAALLAPCKDADDDLEENLRRLFDQNHGFYYVVCIVESEEDPAAAVIRRVMEENPQVAAHLFVAGRASDCGQKVHNLREAIRCLSKHFEVFAFTDADACHDKGWLCSLGVHVYRPGIGAATGYRWFVPQKPTLANLMLYSINSAVAGMFGRGRTNFIWGGSWSIRRDVFEKLKMLDAWKGTLSDDMVARRVVSGGGHQIEFEPRAVAASPVNMSFRQMAEFVRRQMLICRRYSPLYWTGACAAIMIGQIAFWGSLFASVGGWLSGWSGWWQAALAMLILYGLGVTRGWMRQASGLRMLPGYDSQLRAGRRFDVWAGPITGLGIVVGLVACMLGNTISWRGNRYRIERGGKIKLVPNPSRAIVGQVGAHPTEAQARSRRSGLRRSA